MAELQGFLLTCKFKPEKAVKEVKGWADEVVNEKREYEEKKKAKQENVQKKRDFREVEKLQSTLKTVMELGKGKEAESTMDASETKSTNQELPDEVPSSVSGTQSPLSAQESDSDSWMVTEVAPTTTSKD